MIKTRKRKCSDIVSSQNMFSLLKISRDKNSICAALTGKVKTYPEPNCLRQSTKRRWAAAFLERLNLNHIKA